MRCKLTDSLNIDAVIFREFGSLLHLNTCIESQAYRAQALRDPLWHTVRYLI